MNKILIIGDSIADIYRQFSYKKQCPDSPDTPAGILSATEIRPGGVANVAVNLSNLLPKSHSIDMISVLDCETAYTVKRISSNRVNMSDCVIVSSDLALLKERIIFEKWDADNQNFVARLDNRSSIDPVFSRRVSELVKRYLDSSPDYPELVILSDYSGGVVTDELLEVLSPVKDRLLVDTKRTDLAPFSGALLAKLNSLELNRVLLTDHSPERYFKYFVVTFGEKGAHLVMRKNEIVAQIPCSTTMKVEFKAHKVKTVDVCGCGDTFLAGLAAGLVRFQDPFDAVYFANAAAATVVTQERTAVADLSQTLEMMGRNYETR